MTRYSQQSQKKGFTIIEMLVAVFIFTVALAGLMTIASKGLSVARQAQQQVVADYLALEGIEAVRNIRDSAFLSGQNSSTWTGVFDQDECLSSLLADRVVACEIELNDSGIVLRPCETCIVYYNESLSTYKQGVTTPGFVNSGFVREVVLTPITGTNREILITVTVSWDGGEVVYTGDLFLWFPTN